MRKVFEVDVYLPLSPRERLHTCVRYVVLAPDEETALATIRRNLDRIGNKYMHMTVRGRKGDDGVSPLVVQNQFTTCTKEALGKLMGVPLSAPKAVDRKLSDKALGPTQREVLNSLKENPYPNGGWVWGTHSGTVSILETLYARMLVDKVDSRYVISAAGLEAWAALRSQAKQQRIVAKQSRVQRA
ncbi:hypothetical protein LC612_30915 [Nostoc sp. CHAB 5834]|nr:hypothetical protein [Nostoc sp. CHAB 5834]